MAIAVGRAIIDQRTPLRSFLLDPPPHCIWTLIARGLKSGCDELLLQLVVREAWTCGTANLLEDCRRRSSRATRKIEFNCLL